MLKQVKVGAFGTQAQWNLVRSMGVGLSGWVRHLLKTIPIVHRFSPLNCSAFHTPKTVAFANASVCGMTRAVHVCVEKIHTMHHLHCRIMIHSPCDDMMFTERIIASYDIVWYIILHHMHVMNHHAIHL